MDCVVVVVAVEEVDVAPETAAPLEMVARVTQDDDEGAGCAAGVLPSPWWKVEAP